MGATSFLRPRNKTEIQNLLRILAKKYEVRVYQKAIASNHIHLVIKIQSQRLYRAFIRALSGQIARFVMEKQSFKVFRQSFVRERGDGGPAKKETQGLGQQFWQFRPWTRLLSWGKDYRGCCGYVVQNTLEALGFISYTPRGKNLYLRWAALGDTG
jgi:REP element-mobilizing transposase RayT